MGGRRAAQLLPDASYSQQPNPTNLHIPPEHEDQLRMVLFHCLGLRCARACKETISCPDESWQFSPVTLVIATSIALKNGYANLNFFMIPKTSHESIAEPYPRHP